MSRFGTPGDPFKKLEDQRFKEEMDQFRKPIVAGPGESREERETHAALRAEEDALRPHMNADANPTTPALLSAARLDEIRDAAPDPHLLWSHLVIRKRETDPMSAWCFRSHGEAFAFYAKASEQWSDTLLVSVIRGPRVFGSGEQPLPPSDVAALLRHLDALTAPAPADGGEALGLAIFAASDSERGQAPEETAAEWARLLPDARAEMIRQGTALDAQGYARGVAVGEAERARLTAELVAAHDRALAHGVAVVASTARAMQVQIDAWKRAVEALTDLRHIEQDDASTDEQIEAARDAATDALQRARGEDRPPCPGEGWEWDAFALQWFQPGAKGKAIATSRARGEGQGS